MSAWTPYRPSETAPWNVRRVVHLHRRAGFAAPWKVIQRDLRDGPEAAIGRLLSASAPGGDAASDFEQSSDAIAQGAVAAGSVGRLKAWWLFRMLLGPDPLLERLTLMWHNHFATSALKVTDVGMIRRQNNIFRKFARAPFGGMLPRVVKDPALLLWLDAEANRKEHPNENLAREIMELFCLGVGNYTESDVKEAARSLTGWSVKKGAFYNDEGHHDAGEKTIFGKTGHWTGDDLLRLLLEHPAVAGRLAFRICELYMGEGVAGDEAVAELAGGLRQRDLDVGWGVETVLRSNLFFSEGNIGNRVLGPVEYVVGAVRALEMLRPPPSTMALGEWSANVGQDLLQPPNVFGWEGGRIWLTSRGLIARANFAALLVEGRLHVPTRPLAAEALARRHGFARAEDQFSFFSNLLLGASRMPSNPNRGGGSANRLLKSLLASPEAQLG